MLTDKLFVYGTLRPGSKNRYADLLPLNAEHLGIARVRGRLYRVSHYPALVSSQSNDEWAIGDLFSGVSPELLAELDSFEGSSYAREMTQVTLPDDTSVEAFIYGWTLPSNNLERIYSGDWLNN